MKLTDREKKLIIFAVFFSIIVFYFAFILKPLYLNYKTKIDENQSLSLEVNTIKEHISRVGVLDDLTNNLEKKVSDIDIFSPYLENDEIELQLMDICNKYGFSITGFMVMEDSDIKNEQSLKPSNLRLNIKNITITLEGNVNNLDDVLSEIESNKFIELSGLRYFNNLNSEEPLITLELIYFLKEKEDEVK